MSSSSPLLIRDLCQVDDCRSRPDYQASCRHKLCEHHVSRIMTTSDGKLICPIDRELIEDRFSILDDFSRTYPQTLIQKRIESTRGARKCCLASFCFVLLFGAGFTYFQLR